MGWLNVQVADFIQNLHIAGSCIVKPTRLLFLLFINDLHLYIEQCDSDYYADDATVHTSGKTKSDVEAKLQHDRNKTKQWGKQNKMKMHYEKTSCMLLETRHSTQHSQELDIFIDGNKIKNVTKRKLLGI